MEELEVIPLIAGESESHYFSLLRTLRDNGYEAMGEINGVRFNIMTGESVEQAYGIASRNHGVSQEAIEERRKTIRELALTRIKAFIAVNKGNTKITTSEIIEFLRSISSATKMAEGLDIPQELCDEVIGILQEVGYKPIEPEKAYSTSNEEEIEGYSSIRVWDGCPNVPDSEADRLLKAYREEFSTYVIENAMLQLKSGSLDRLIEYFCLEARERNISDPRVFDK